MATNVLALGLDPEFADYSKMPGLKAATVQQYVDQQFDRLRAAGYFVDSCLVDPGETAEKVVKLHLESRTYDCVLISAELRAPEQLLLFEKLLNLVHARAPTAKICFNTTPADSAEAVQRWA